jgi:hypothetical protein
MKVGNIRRLAALGMVLCPVSISFGQVQSTQTESKIPPMRRIYVEDQRDRGVLLTDAGDDIKPDTGVNPPERPLGVSINARDTERRNKVRELLAHGQVVTAQDFHDAAFIFQHGDSPDDYLLAHILAMEAVVKGNSASKWIAAATLDRYLQMIGQKQVFGTQFLDERYRYFLQHRNDSDFAEKMKGVPAGITQQPYDDRLMPDSLRADFCVPDLKQQTQAVQDANNSSDHSLVIPHGCAR